MHLCDRSDKYRKFRDKIASLLSRYVGSGTISEISEGIRESRVVTSGAITEKIVHLLDLYEHTGK